MASPDEKTTSFQFEGKTYRLHLGNAGKRAAEEFAKMSMSDMAVRMNENPLGSPTVLTALLWGATRKYSSRTLLHPSRADEIMDAMDDADEEAVMDFSAAIIACFYGMEKQEWLDILSGDLPEEDEPEEPDEEGSDAAEPEEDPKAQKKDSEKPTPSRSGAGKGSSKKE